MKVIAFAGGLVAKVGVDSGLTVWEEAFADRAYQNNGKLVPRTQPNAVFNDTTEVVSRVSRLVSEQKVETIDGQNIELNCDTICVHSDSGNSPEIVRQLSELLRLRSGMG